MSRWVPVFAAAALGFAVGFLVRGDSDAPALRGRADRRTADDAFPSVPTTAHLPVGGARAADGTSSDPLAAALAALPPPARLQGSGRISGTVLTPDGAPVAGARVVAYPSEEPDRVARNDEDELLATLRDAIHSHRFREAGRVETTTAADGSFVLTGLADLGYGAESHADGYSIAADFESWPLVPGTFAKFIATPVVTLSITVLMPDGSRAESASIYGSNGDDAWHENWTSDEPTMDVTPGTWKVVASHGEGLRSVRQTVVVDASHPNAALTFRLEPTPHVKGVVQVLGGTLVHHVYVYVYALRLREGEAVDFSRLVEEGERESVSTDYAKFFFDLPTPGRYVVGVGFGSVIDHRVLEVAGPMSVEFTLDSWGPDRYFAVTVLDPAGEPVEDVDFSMGGADSLYSIYPALRREGDNAYLIPIRGDHDRFLVEAHASDYGTVRVPGERGAERATIIRFGNAGKIRVTLDGYAKHEFRDDFRATLFRPGERDLAIAEAARHARAPDETGTVLLGPIQAGEWGVAVCVRSGYEYFVAGKTTLVVGPGIQETRVALPALHRLVVRTSGLRVGTTFELEPSEQGDWRDIQRSVAADGRLVFTGVPAGRYRLRGYINDDEKVMTLDVPSASELVWQPHGNNALVVRILRRDGKAALAGFQDGDVVIAIDGHEFEGGALLNQLLPLLMAKPTVKATVTRAGRVIEIECNGRELVLDREGARFEPTIR